MGNNSGPQQINRDQIILAEEKILAISGLPPSQVISYDQPIWSNATIRTVEIGFTGA